ncbi:hypothetical protein RM844_29925 [Streptomyces sp. DSM 44915]|uniref:Secreted protein n=1 Tax=Streptomyces chisholmiae TaxID=3075540 RepID=A0ABU2JZS4_9ACTN|nr:hypothetical protein [Streptomyces sp. DSM 44915]MDT0270498.1 hypothetical protein [Streptomyces sp. DSM 44915]
MNTATRVGAFGAVVALAFGTAFGVGALVGPVGAEPAAAHGGPGGHGADDDPQDSDTSDTSDTSNHGDHGDSGGHTGSGGDNGANGADDGHGHHGVEESAAETVTPGGLQVAERGYTLLPPTEPLPAGERTELAFRIAGPDGGPLTAYQVSHEKELHLIVVRRDLTGFQHLHPELAEDGTWTVPITLPAAGGYRMFADFLPAGEETGLTLGADLSVAGEYAPEPLPEPAATATVDDYTVELTAADGAVRAGAATELTLTVRRDGEPVTDLEPYLGAYGHLVALRAGDLGYLHVHPQGEPGDGVTAAGPEITFHTTMPSAGTYRLYLDFQHEGEVRTAEFTVRAGAAAETGADDPGAHAGDGHQH